MAITRIAVVLLVLGLVAGAGAGYGVGFVVYQPQISRLSSDLSASRSAVESLQGQLNEVQVELKEAYGEVSTLTSSLRSVQAKLAALEADLARAQEYLEFKSNVTALFNSLREKLDLEDQMIKVLIYYQRNETAGLAATMSGLGQYVDAVGDDELSAIWDELRELLIAREYALVNAKFIALMERNSSLIQSDLSDLQAILKS